ncbi:MAG: LPS export ABC transporter periplasmic protein LptC [Sneathiella sp.]|jgi:lipopolysaccharide export system protein LptC|uniref:LPS export ABC transporter periplasmic protein LptC n=1 Tax=Sneathiella sp. TaxID=1964365 RepID=UPI000C52BAB8|nr:LPS export ABC transporter periplasmic protein LptC [Sneathiella sp.]MAL79046.1 LPS export ABC transporter periplasmic protein LptC [Sneathiella sp.]|tara:strand:+ start:1585 stop:2262 length:678 start_codon:yes stop_codon:yes gene_type:complete
MKPADAIPPEEKISNKTLSGAKDFLGTPSLVEAKFNARYSHFVSIIKFILLGLAILLIGLAFILPNLDQPEGFTLDYADVTVSDDGLTMKNPQYVASDINEQQYVVTADTATQKSPTATLVALKNLQADITLTSGDWISITAPEGELNTETGILDLYGKIDIFSDSGNQLAANSARVDLKQQTVVSQNPLKGHGPLGTIEADSLAADQITGNIRFDGNVKLTINP